MCLLLALVCFFAKRPAASVNCIMQHKPHNAVTLPGHLADKLTQYGEARLFAGKSPLV
jgi:hypothetical protein